MNKRKKYITIGAIGVSVVLGLIWVGLLVKKEDNSMSDKGGSQNVNKIDTEKSSNSVSSNQDAQFSEDIQVDTNDTLEDVVFKEYTQREVKNTILLFQPNLGKQKGFDIVSATEPLDGWLVVVLRPRVNPDNVYIGTVLKHEANGLSMQVEPFPGCMKEFYVNKAQVPQLVKSEMINRMTECKS